MQKRKSNSFAKTLAKTSVAKTPSLPQQTEVLRCRLMPKPGLSVYSHDQRDIATPLCGNLRPQPESSKNPLLGKPQLGTVKPAVWDLPSKTNFHHEYGLRQFRDGIGSADVLGGWAQHSGTADQMAGRDFKQLNCEAAVVGKTTAKGFAEYRLTHDARLKAASIQVPLPIPYDKNTTFGRSTAATIPMADLFSHAYRFEWQQTAPTAAECAAAKKSKKPGPTKTSSMQAQVSHAKVAALEAKETFEAAHLDGTAGPDGLWKMKAFASVPPKVGHRG